MQCKKCKTEIPAESVFCMACGAKQAAAERHRRTRGNGLGSAYKLPSGKWRAEATVGYTPEGRRIYKTKSTFKTKREALEYLPALIGSGKATRKITLKYLYDKWLPTHRASKSAINCYRAAFAHFKPLWFKTIENVEIDELQKCMDGCPYGKRTKQDMRTVCGLIYKYGIPRGLIPDKINMAQFLIITAEKTEPKRAFDSREISLIKESCGLVPYAEYVYCMIYTGFRIGEFVSLDVSNYHSEQGYVIGGAKTEAGTNRTVTLSPKIKKIVDGIANNRTAGPLFPCVENGKHLSIKKFRNEIFYKVLEASGITSPRENKLTPHCCRHTFATLMKNIDAAEKDKLELIGHTTGDMLRHYQDVKIDDLKKITDML
ncbi:MAG: tyrosine-type recombinase/integrase [Firmicutes bacterium]|nr:tyrosine-type recombinase/integrase [Bacillota bacterium]